LQVFHQLSCMMYRLKAQILHFILVTVARQPDKHALDNHAVLTCHPGRNANAAFRLVMLLAI
jgi:hypothetical protein